MFISCDLFSCVLFTLSHILNQTHFLFKQNFASQLQMKRTLEKYQIISPNPKLYVIM